MFCAILICAALAEFTSCKKGIPTYDVNPQDIDLADLEWDLDFPYEVFMSPKAAQELKDSFLHLSGKLDYLCIDKAIWGNLLSYCSSSSLFSRPMPMRTEDISMWFVGEVRNPIVEKPLQRFV